MGRIKFNKELYSKIALIKAAYNYTDVAFLHLDADEHYYYVIFETKPGHEEIREQDFLNEMLAQSVRHEIYSQTKNIRELLLARAMATSVVFNDDAASNEYDENCSESFSEDDILKDWFEDND
jgi:His-Xaa-Ser system protein HxsD